MLWLYISAPTRRTSVWKARVYYKKRWLITESHHSSFLRALWNGIGSYLNVLKQWYWTGLS
jgi:hypothetical protein